MTTTLSGVIADHIAAVNAFDTEAIMDTFSDDAYVVAGDRREFRGADAVRGFIERDFVGDRVTVDVREVVDHHGDTIIRVAYDGDFDKTDLPDEVILSNYFSVRGGKIISLVIILNQPAELKQ